MSEIITTTDYKNFIEKIKSQIQQSQIKAAVSVNVEMLKLYWFMGEQIVEKQKSTKWGDGFLKQLSQDLKAEFPDIKGFSKRNLEIIRRWYLFWCQEISIAKQLVSQLKDEKESLLFQIPWGQNIVIITKSKSIEEALFYVQKTIENNWSRNVLVHQIESGLYKRTGKAITNFEKRLPATDSDLANQILKDPYNFDFLTMRERYDEKELEDALTTNITEFLLELGSGFSYIGKQYKLTVDNEDFYIDLLFYHTKLHSYVVIELKTGKFKPEYAGKLNFYVSAIDGELKTEQDNSTIGILICKEKKKTIVEYALKDISKPIGVSEYMLTKHLPDEYKSSLPNIEEIERKIGGGDE
ncbi:MAG: PDDEXK nuclease domain-containing protein [Victivallaceae bacterium]|nr:PDDEXK nuclease domain-containing protein [Victivallaceae bacterium]